MHRKKDDNSIITILSRSTKFLFILCFSLFLFIPVSVQAKVAGVCSTCHTMHNSQNGSNMQILGPGESDTGPKDALLRGTCLGCHSSTSGATSIDSVTGAPIVFNSSEPSYNSAKGLAAGNFYYVQNPADDAKGHNALANNPESTLTVAPGKAVGCVGSNSCHVNIHGTTGPPFFDFGGSRQGCTKCHMVGSSFPKGYHHKDDTGPLIDSAAEGWYRFLDGHQPSGAGHGVTGIEDNDWELETSTDHNEYLGYDDDPKNIPMTLGSFGGTHTMTAYCCGCHGNFHIEDTTPAGASPWIRHPSDTVLPNSGEYSAYTTYDPLVPVARPDLVSGGWSSSSNTIRPGTDAVMCLSCHRAHASPYFKMMRWDYRGWPGSGTNGCNRCHTSKN